MRKILHITSQLAKNGTETFIMNVFRHIDRNVVSFDFLVFTNLTDGFYDEVIHAGANLYRLPPRRKGVLRYAKALDAFFKEHAQEYSAIHYSSCSLTSILPVYFAKKYKVPIRIVHSHNSQNARGWHNFVLHKINKHIVPFLATHFFACSDLAADWFYSHTKVRDKVTLIKNGIDLELFGFNDSIRNNYRKILGVSSETMVIGNVSRFSPVKNHSFLLEIFTEITKRRKDVVLWLVGTGKLLETIRKKVQDMGLEKQVIFLGQRNDVYHILKGMDFFVFPSLFEGLPFSLIEAQASGLPVFSSDQVTQKVAITDNVHFISLNKAAGYWAEEILKYNMYYFRQEQNTKIIESGYSIEQTVQCLMNIYLLDLPIISQ